METSYNMLAGDCVKSLPTLAPAIVQAFVTSPPYWGLRDYGIAPTEWPEIRYAPMAGLPELVIPATVCCLGLEPTPEAFIGHLLHVFRLAAPALKADGTCWVNLGDTYAHDTAKKTSFRKDRAEVLSGVKQETPIKKKNLVGIPWRFAFAMQADGWILRQDLVWHKPNPMPESVTDRCTKAHEYIFLFAKQSKYYFNAEAIREESSPSSVARAHLCGGAPSPKNLAGVEKGVFAAPMSTAKMYGQGRNKRSVWTVATKPYSEAHFATFPPALIEPCILAGTRPGDVVCDMFSGSGTTGQEALRHGRAYIGMEAKPENVKLHHKRMRGLQYHMPLSAAAL